MVVYFLCVKVFEIVTHIIKSTVEHPFQRRFSVYAITGVSCLRESNNRGTLPTRLLFLVENLQLCSSMSVKVLRKP